jgi:hypothetical protein
MWGTTTYTSQDSIQIFILVISILCIPVMLCVKPVHQICQMKKHKNCGLKARENSDSLE